MKRILTLILTVALTQVYAQQQQQFDQFNKFGVVQNPGFTGMELFTEAHTSYRNQWSGLSNSPNSVLLSMNGRLRKKKEVSTPPPFALPISDNSLYKELAHDTTFKEFTRHGLGGYVMRDQFGPFTTLNAMLNYAYHLPLNKKWTASFGVSAGVGNQSINSGLITVIDNEDVVYNNVLMGDPSSTNFAANVGVTLYTDQFFFGYGNQQLIGNSVFEEVGDDINLSRHHFFSTGYRFEINDNFDLLPTAIVKVVDNTPLSYDAALRLRYKQVIWGGFAYRSSENVSANIGFNIFKSVFIGYAYGFGFNGLRDFNNGSHEISLGVRFWGNNLTPKFLW